GTFDFDKIQFLLNYAFPYNSNLRNLEQQLHLETFADVNFAQDEWQIEFPAGQLVNNVKNNAGADQILHDSARLYDALLEEVQHKLGTNQLLGSFGVAPSRLIDDISDGDTDLLALDGTLLAYEVADPCEEEEVTTVDKVMTVGATADTIATILQDFAKLSGV